MNPRSLFLGDTIDHGINGRIPSTDEGVSSEHASRRKPDGATRRGRFMPLVLCLSLMMASARISHAQTGSPFADVDESQVMVLEYDGLSAFAAGDVNSAGYHSPQFNSAEPDPLEAPFPGSDTWLPPEENVGVGREGFDSNEEPFPAPAPLWKTVSPRRLSATTAWLGGGGDEGLGSLEVDLSATWLAPFPWSENSFVSVTPSFSIQSLDGPVGVSLPSELYQASVMFSWAKPLNERTQLAFGLAPGVFSDFNGGGSDAFRLIAFGTLTWQSSPTKKWSLGVVATGRDDIPVLPMAGLTWTPNDKWLIELTAPRPRVSYRLSGREGCGSHWIYAAGEFGGGTWAVNREGRGDELTIRDFRFILGWEKKDSRGINPRVEAGYVFGRRLEYQSDGYQFDPSNTVMVRAGFSF